jgi:hypothetical protein
MSPSAGIYLRFHPESSEAHYLRGVLLDILGRDEPARQALARAIALQADPTDALKRRSFLSFQAGDCKTAIQEITRVSERHPLVPESYERRVFYREFLSDRRGARRPDPGQAPERAERPVNGAPGGAGQRPT